MDEHTESVLEPTWVRRVWLASCREQAAARQVEKAMGSLSSDQRVLFIGADSGALGCHLEAMGGHWTQTTLRADAVSYMRAYALAEPLLLAESPLPFEDGSFDIVIISRVLENLPDDHAIIEDVHRVLGERGLLIVHVASSKKYACARQIRRLMKLSPHTGQVRAGYSYPALFEIMKDGFDVEEVGTYARFWTECVGVFAERLLAKAHAEQLEPSGRQLALLRMAGHMAKILDLLFFWTKGYHTVAKAHRRIWKPRITPRLRDGRSIADAALNTKIGTAAPF